MKESVENWCEGGPSIVESPTEKKLKKYRGLVSYKTKCNEMCNRDFLIEQSP